MRQMPLRGRVGTLWGEGADVQFVDDRIAQGLGQESRTLQPAQRARVDHMRIAVHPVGLPARARIWQRIAAVDRVLVAAALARRIELDPPIAVPIGAHGDPHAGQYQLHGSSRRRPYGKYHHTSRLNSATGNTPNSSSGRTLPSSSALVKQFFQAPRGKGRRVSLQSPFTVILNRGTTAM